MPAATRPEDGTMATLNGSFPAKVFDDFSKKEVIDFLEILHYASQAATKEEVGKVLHLTKRRIPCRHMIAGVLEGDPHARPGSIHNIVNASYPNGWVSLYLRNRHAEVDPVLRYRMQSGSNMQLWANTYRHAMSTTEQESEAKVRGFSLLTGLTPTQCDLDLGLSSFFSFVSDSVPVPSRYRSVLAYLSTYLHGALLRITASPRSESIDILSPREKTVLNWIRHGKTNWEISKILGVSERTVRFHVEGIFNKLNVTSRTQAVAYAMENGLQVAQ